MSLTARDLGLFAGMGIVLAMVAMFQSPQLAVAIVNMSLISAIMALGVNMQWGYAGLFNVGIMGFTAVGGLAVVLIAQPPVPEAWAAGGLGILLGLMLGVATILAAVLVYKRMQPGKLRGAALFGVILVGYLITSMVFGPAKQAVQAVNPASEGYLGGANLPVILAWPVGAVFAAGVAWVVGKVALGLRSDYLAIATLGI